jgi:uncharacterized membrane protein
MMRRLFATSFGLAPQQFFIVAALLGGLVLVFATPPFQVPDEPAHFYRAFSVSEGRLAVRADNGRPGEMLPSSLHRLVDVLIDDVPRHPDQKIPPGSWRTARELELEPDKRMMLFFPTAAQFTAVPYLPQAAGIAVGRMLGAPPLALVFFARIANLIAAVTLIYLALCQLPAYRWLATLLAMTPMAMFLRSSISADAVTTAIAFVLTATVAKLAFGPVSSAKPGDLGLVIASSAALSLTKPVYFPLVFLVFVVPGDRLSVRTRGVVLFVILAVSICAVTAALVMALPSVSAISVLAESRIVEVLARPFHVAGLVVVDYVVHAPRYGAHFIGRLGWLDTALPVPLLLAYLGFLIAYTVLDTDTAAVIRPWQRIVIALVVAASLMAIGTAMYLYMGRIAGIQGRYFHPIAVAAVWLFHSSRRPRCDVTRWLGPGVVLMTSISLVVTLLTIYCRYYG